VDNGYTLPGEVKEVLKALKVKMGVCSQGYVVGKVDLEEALLAAYHSGEENKFREGYMLAREDAANVANNFYADEAADAIRAMPVKERAE